MSRRSFTPQEAFEASLGYFNGDTLAAKSWVSKYALKNSDGEVFERTPDDMHERLADELHRIEKKYPNPVSYDEIYEALRDFKYLIPAGSPMTGIGNDLQVSSISNCFVAGNESDSYGGIMRTDEQLVQLMKRRGGVGTDLSHIRPETAPVNNAALTSSGVVSFMDRFSNSTREVAQSGRRKMFFN